MTQLLQHKNKNQMCPTKKTKLSRKFMGVSLLEVIIGMTILGFAISPLVMLFLQGARSSATESSRVQALFLAQKVLSEIKARIGGNPGFIYNIPINIPFKITRKDDFSFLSYKGASFLQKIYQQDLPITPANPFYEQYKKFSILIENEAVGKKQYKITVKAIWKNRGKKRQVELAGLVETIPNQFTLRKK